MPNTVNNSSIEVTLASVHPVLYTAFNITLDVDTEEISNTWICSPPGHLFDCDVVWMMTTDWGHCSVIYQAPNHCYKTNIAQA